MKTKRDWENELYKIIDQFRGSTERLEVIFEQLLSEVFDKNNKKINQKRLIKKR